MASIDENKNSHQKNAMTHTQTTCPNCIALHVGKKGVRPAEVGALASVFKKPATELKLKQNLLKCKRTMQIATFNVKTLNRIGKLPELTVSLIDHNIDFICKQEHRYTHSEDTKCHDTGNGWTLATSSAWKNYQCHGRGCSYSYRTTSPKITKQYRENSTKDDGSYF